MSNPIAYNPSPAFKQAAAFLSNASSLASTPNTTKLELYGLYKLLTVSAAPGTTRPSIFSPTERAKYDAWKSAGQDWKGREAEAEVRYMDIARSLGWTPESESQAVEAGPSEPVAERTAEELLAMDSDEETGGGGGGMGLAVSTMQREETDGNESLHELAIIGDATKLQAYLESNPETDVNAVDEYGFTALHLACDRGHAAIVDVLLHRGADTSLKDSDGLSALELAIEANNENIAALLRSRSKAEP